VPHKDTEKEKGMFGSLVITLPSDFEGGDLIVRHQSLEKRFTVNNPEFSSSWAAFFADCKHEIVPVTKGYRMALIYNLVHVGKTSVPTPASTEMVFQVIDSLKEWEQKRFKSWPKVDNIGRVRGVDAGEKER